MTFVHLAASDGPVPLSGLAAFQRFRAVSTTVRAAAGAAGAVRGRGVAAEAIV